MSFLRSLHDAYVMPQVFHFAADESVELQYELDGTVYLCTAVIRSQRAQFAETASGDRVKRVTCEVLFSVDEHGPWRGIPNPQLKGLFTVRTSCGTETEWKVDSEDGQAFEAATGSWVIAHLIRHEGAAKSFEGYRTR